MRVLITGGTGFIGSHLAVRCAEMGWNTSIVDREINLFDSWNDSLNESKCKYEFFHKDMISKVVLKRVLKQEYDVIFHQAAIPRVSYSVEHPAETTDENVLKTVQLLEAAKGNCRRFVFASSSSVYGGAEQTPTPETCPLVPKSPYALQKKVGEEFCRMFGSLYDMDTICLRYFNVFGSRQLGNSAYSTAISAWCHAIKEGLPLRKDGSGEQSRDLCYVDNVVHANVMAATSLKSFKGEAFNIACGDRVSNNEILQNLQNRYPELKINESPFRVGDVMHSQADITLAQQQLEYNPQVKFWDGFEKTLQWWGI